VIPPETLHKLVASKHGKQDSNKGGWPGDRRDCIGPNWPSLHCCDQRQGIPIVPFPGNSGKFAGTAVPISPALRTGQSAIGHAAVSQFGGNGSSPPQTRHSHSVFESAITSPKSLRPCSVAQRRHDVRRRHDPGLGRWPQETFATASPTAARPPSTALQTLSPPDCAAQMSPAGRGARPFARLRWRAG